MSSISLSTSSFLPGCNASRMRLASSWRSFSFNLQYTGSQLVYSLRGENPKRIQKTYHRGLSGNRKMKVITMMDKIPDPAIGNLQVTSPVVNDIPNDIHSANDNPVPQYIPNEET